MVVEQAYYIHPSVDQSAQTRDQADPDFLAEVFALSPQNFKKEQREDLEELALSEVSLLKEEKILSEFINNAFPDGELVYVGGTATVYSEAKRALFIQTQEGMIVVLKDRIAFLKKLTENRQKIIDETF